MNKRLVVIFSVVTLDAVGIGLIFPILPSLLRAVTNVRDISVLYGVILALYAAMQFVFAPVLGALSDRFGRRPVLLGSIAGAAVDYLFMAFSPAFWVLLVGRAIAGITGANMSVATAYVADVTDEADRTARFGQMSACFGLGFIVGPVIGGLLGQVWVRAPFLAAAVLNAVNLALVYLILPESRAKSEQPLMVSAFNPIGPMRRAFELPSLLPLIAISFVFNFVGNMQGNMWVLYGEDKFRWNGLTVGLSLAGFGLCHAGAQAFLTGPMSKRFGDVRTIGLGIAFDNAAIILIALATRGWMAFALSPLFALGGVGLPALQSLMANQVSDEYQGELQGVLASITSLTAILGPLIGTTIYSLTRSTWTGAVWIIGSVVYLSTTPALLLYWHRHRSRTTMPLVELTES